MPIQYYTKLVVNQSLGQTRYLVLFLLKTKTILLLNLLQEMALMPLSNLNSLYWKREVI